MFTERVTKVRNLDWAANDRTGIHNLVKLNLKRKLREKKKQKEKRDRKSTNSPLLKYLKQRDSHFLDLVLPEKLNNGSGCKGQRYRTDRRKGWKVSKKRQRDSTHSSKVTRVKR